MYMYVYTNCFYRLFTEVTSSQPAMTHDRHKSKTSSHDHTYVQCAIKLLDLLDTLYHRTSTVYAQCQHQTTETGVSILWHKCWCPLLEVRPICTFTCCMVAIILTIQIAKLFEIIIVEPL